MPATISLCQRTGPVPGVINENMPAFIWKAIDDTTTPYNAYNAVLGLGVNSFTVYNYVKFTGSFTTISNVTISRGSGNFGYGINLYASGSPLDSSQRPVYIQPTRSASSLLTPVNFTSPNTTVKLLVGSAPSEVDGPGYDGKASSANNIGQTVYSTYFITQLQVSSLAQTGNLANIAIEISYNEI